MSRLHRRFALALGAALLPLTGAATVMAGESQTVLLSRTAPSGDTYEVIEDPNATWTSANASAQTAGGFLATIGDSAEQTFIQNLLVDAKAPSAAYWFGLHKDNDGIYRAVDGTIPTYTHWSAGEPNNGNNQENSATVQWSQPTDLTFYRRGFWNDLADGHGDPRDIGLYPDLLPGGYLVEFAGPGGTNNNGGGGGTGGGGGGGGGQPSGIPLPSAMLLFPAGALVAAWSSRRMKLHGA